MKPDEKYGAVEIGQSWFWVNQTIADHEVGPDGCSGPHGIMWAARPEPEVFAGDELQLFGLAKRAKKAHDERGALIVTPHELLLLNDYIDREGKGGPWEKALTEAFRDALPHISASLEPGAAAFASLPIVVRRVLDA